MTLTVVLENYRLKKLPTPPPKNEKRKTRNELRRDHYRRNRERIRAQRKEYRQRNLEKCRAQERASRQRYWQKNRGSLKEKLTGQSKKHAAELQKEWRRKNRDAINERRREQRRTNRDALNKRRREHRRQHCDAINRVEREYRRKHRETYNRIKRLYYWMKRIATRAEVPTATPCDCGLCLVCGGFETESWSRSVVVPRSDPLEVLERRLDRMDVCSDTSSEVDPRWEEELERVLNETSSDEADSEPEETDVEDVVSCLNRETTGVTTELRDMERWFQQFDCEDEAQPDEYTQTLMVTSNLMNELERFLFS